MSRFNADPLDFHPVLEHAASDEGHRHAGQIIRRQKFLSLLGDHMDFPPKETRAIIVGK